MADAYTCQRCGAVVGAEAAQGLCPACLLQQGLGDSRPTAPSARAGGGAELTELARLFPQLEVLELVGRGGMGVVYKARQRGLDRLVALKVLPPEVDRDPGFRERFVREARALARLTHPNIVAVYDFGQVEGRYYFLMEYVDGANLRKMLQAGHLMPQQAMAIVPQLCDALQFAHEEGIVHRDIKPENILLDRKGRVKIADFGLAKLLGTTLEQDAYTLTGARQVLGTPHYMAPEQFEHPGTVDHRADIYSMGVVFYEMLTGELPLGRFAPPSRKVQVDVRLDEVVLRTLEKEPEQRYQRAGEVKTELASLATLPADGGPPTWSAGGPPAGRPWDGAPAPAAGPPQVSLTALLGLAAALPFSIAMAVLVASTPGPQVIEEWIAVIAVLGILSAVLSCGLGVEAIRRIRRSAGRLYGLKLALFDALLFPLLVIDLIILDLLMLILDPGPGAADRLGIVLCLAILAMDALIVWRIWKRVSRPLPPVWAPPPAGHPAMPARPPYPPSHYALPPRRRLGCLVVLGVVAAILVLVFVLYMALAIPALQRQRAEASRFAIGAGQGYISADPSSDPGGSPRMAHAYRFMVRSPANAKTTVWVEIWRDGKLEPTPGFPVTQWVIPPQGQAFNGYVTLKLGAPEKGQIDAEWDISGTIGSTHAEHRIPDPFDKTNVNDSTWGPWGGAWAASPAQAIQILAIRGTRDRFAGTLTDEWAVGKADGEIRAFVRFDGLSPAQMQSGTTFGESQDVPDRSLPKPTSAPAPLISPPPPPATRGTAAEGLVR